MEQEKKEWSQGKVVKTVEQSSEYAGIPKHKGTRPNIPRKRLDIRLDAETYGMLLDMCIKKRCTITDYLTDIIQRQYLGRMAIVTGRLGGRGPSSQTVAAPSRITQKSTDKK